MGFGVILLRLALAVVLGGLVGIERENKKRPAGFRTHILVCVGSAIVMITSEYIFNKYRGLANIDPARLGAQVISGIGFLGAGTIIRNGISIKGLTTAASLWAVACVGLAIGIGFYDAAVAGAVIIYLTLILLRQVEKMMEGKTSDMILNVRVENKPGKIGEIGVLLGKAGINIRNMDFLNEDEDEVLIRFTLRLPHGVTRDKVIKEISSIQGAGVEE